MIQAVAFSLRRLSSLPLDGAAFAEAIRQGIRRRGISARMLALRTGVNHATVARIAKGTQAPSLRTAIRLAQALEPLP